jgi:hypothetical protein
MVSVTMSNNLNSHQTLKQIKNLETYLNELKMVPDPERLGNAVILALLSKALTVSRAICLLVDAGYPAEAFGLSRTLIEIYFWVRYIGNQDTDARAKTYVDYYEWFRQKHQNNMRTYYPNRPLEDSALDEESVKTAAMFKNKSNWTGHKLKDVAHEEDTVDKDEHERPYKAEFDYDAIYFWTSHFVHASVVGVLGHACVGEEFKVRANTWVDKGRAQSALTNIAIYLGKMFTCACHSLNTEQPAAMKSLYDMTVKLADGRPLSLKAL